MFFKDVIGQEAVKERLRRSVQEQRISHAQLFLENEGYGALPLAIAYAAYISCRQRTDDDACGVCPSCVKFKKFSHPDLHFVYPTIKTDSKRISRDYFQEWLSLLDETDCYCSLPEWIEKLDASNKQATIYVEEADQIIKTLNYKSYESEYKVVIIWLVEKMQHQAAPKLLKVLEEPPEKTLFLLITQSPEEMLATIKSRTQLLRIPPIETHALQEAIKNNFEETPDNIIHRTANLAEGSWTKAQRLIEANEEEREYFDLFVEWMRICFVSDVPKALSFAERFAKIGRERQKSFFSAALQLLHLFVQYHTGGINAVKTGEDERAFIEKFARYITLSNVDLYAEEFEQAIAHLERNANTTILFTDISMKVMSWIYKEKPKK